MTLTPAEVRAINLIEVLKEAAEEAGAGVTGPPENAKSWSEDAIRAYFASGGAADPAPAPKQPRLPPPDDATFARWFPGLPLSRTARAAPRARVLCFANAGNAEDMYTSEGTGPRRAPSPLLEWCRAAGAECLAPQYPGRAMRLSEPRAASAAALAAALLPAVASRLYDAPYAIVAHSVGTWVAYEFLRAAAAAGVPPPAVFVLSAMPAPGLPLAERPWRPQRALDEAAFIEECRGWDISEVVFSPAMWPAYQPLLRADFSLFDEYPERAGGNGEDDDNDDGDNGDSAPFPFPLVAFWGARDRRVTEAHVRGWARLAGGRFSAEAVDGNHLWPLERGAKAAWLARVAAELGAALGGGGGGGSSEAA